MRSERPSNSRSGLQKLLFVLQILFSVTLIGLVLLSARRSWGPAIMLVPCNLTILILLRAAAFWRKDRSYALTFLLLGGTMLLLLLLIVWAIGVPRFF